MEEGNVMRLSSLRPSGTLKSSLSGKSSPRSSSPSYRRLNSGRTPRREGSRNSAVGYNQWCRSNRIVLWLLLITLWAYAGFYVQSKWAHEDKDDRPFGYGNNPDEENPDFESNISSSNNNRRGLISNETTLLLPKIKVQKNESNVVSSSKKGSSGDRTSSKKRRKRSRGKKVQNKVKRTVTVDENDDEEVMGDEIMKRNTTYGLLVGPFRSIEDRILEWSPEKRSGTCDRRSGFSRIVWSRKFVLVFHELSMTGAPLAMMELATEFLSCGATVTVVVLSRKGGLMGELKRRKINVLEDKDKVSFKIASKADLIIAGSAVCSSWIEQYFEHTLPGSSSQVAWWIMENRREYFDRSKPVLDQVKKLIFLSESQTKQWLTWCKEDNITLKSDPTIIPLSVNDELAFVAGISSSLNTPSFNKEKMTEKRQVLRRTVRTEMGLSDQDMLAVCLSSINPGKGQIYVLESARLLMENGNGESSKTGESVKILFGSVGSKSNKVAYVKALLGFLSLHSNLSKSVLWTPATTRIASLYAAADVYVMNSQGLGETFGRVTIEAMAFGLPVLGTDAGGTKEIVEDNVTGFLHPVGRPGAAVLAKNLEFLLKNGSLRQEMGNQGRKKVEEMYLKKNMFKKFGEVLFKCMRIKSR